jgi:hypothetical protein
MQPTLGNLRAAQEKRQSSIYDWSLRCTDAGIVHCSSGKEGYLACHMAFNQTLRRSRPRANDACGCIVIVGLSGEIELGEIQ